MPDYNPAVAATGLNTEGPDLTKTIGALTNIQVGQAHAGLLSLQQLQTQRQYDALQGYAAEMRGSGNLQKALQAYSDRGGNPEGLNSLASAGSQMTFMRQHGNLNPQGAEANANIGRIGAETTNIRAGLPGILSKNEIEANNAQEAQRKTLAARAIDLGNNPSADNAQNMLNDHSLHMTDLNRTRLQMAVQNGDTDAIRGMANEMQSAVMTPEERAKFVQPGTPAQPPAPAQVAGPAQTAMPMRPAVPAQPTTLTNARGAAAQTAAGTADVDYTKKTTEAATTARQVNSTLGNIARDAEKLPVGRGMAEYGEGRAWLQSIYDNNIMGAKSWMPEPNKDATAAYDSILKNSGLLTRQALMQTHERAAIAYGLIQSQLPGPETSRAGMQRVIAEWQGVNDDQDYKQRVMAKSPLAGRSDQFESEWNSNVNPLAFMLNRMDPTTRSQVIHDLKQTAAGQQTLGEVQNTITYLKKNGF